MNESTVQQSKGKWNVVYNTTIAGTVSQEKIDEMKKWVKKNPTSHEGIYRIELTPESPDEDYAKYLMLTGEVIEQENIDMEIEDCEKIE